MNALAPAPLPHPEEAGLWRALADGLRPRPRVRPSEWAERHVVLTDEMSPGRAGPFRCDFLPWTRAIHDVMYDNPGKQGVVVVKRAQIGFTRAVLNIIACYCHTRGGPILYLISDDKQARHYATAHFKPLTEREPLKALFDLAVEEGDKRDLMCERPYHGGRVDFAGGGSPGAVSSRTYVFVFVDELEIVLDNFKASAGSPIGFVEARTSAMSVRDVAERWYWSHPRTSERGIDPFYESQSDQRAWMFDCPHCGGAVDPAWSCVHVEGLDAGPKSIELGKADPARAVFRCPRCAAVITDAQRAAALWPAARGGSGRFESRLAPGEAARRPYVGLAIHGLADPYTTVAQLVDKLMRCRTEGERQAFFNLQLGERYDSAAQAVTLEHVRERLQEQQLVLVPGGRLGVKYVCAGGDIQAPEANPTIYLRVEAFAASGTKFVTHFAKLSGWTALAEFLRLAEVRYTDDQGTPAGVFGVSLCSLDCAWATGQVLDFCRTILYSAAGNHQVQLLPVRYAAHIKSTMPAVLPAESKRIDPARPWLGLQERYDLHRETWVHREMMRWQDGRVAVLCRPPEDLAAHITANVRRPAPDVHHWGNDALVWEKIKDGRDDWMQAGAYCEAGAAIKLQLDRIHELDLGPAAPGTGQDGAPAGDERPGFFDRFRRRANWY